MPDESTPSEAPAEPPPPPPPAPSEPQVWPDPSDYETRAPDEDNSGIRIPESGNIRTT